MNNQLVDLLGLCFARWCHRQLAIGGDHRSNLGASCLAGNSSVLCLAHSRLSLALRLIIAPDLSNFPVLNSLHVLRPL